MISHKYKYIFVHIPKCGGSSIEKALLKLEGISFPGGSMPLKNLDKATGDEFLLGGGRQHITIDQYPDAGYFKFAFVRNPWCRMVSEYIWRRQVFNLPENSFRQFILNPPTSKAVDHLWPQLWFTKDKMNFIGKFENLQDDFNAVLGRLNLPQQKLTHENFTQHNPYWEYYDDETRKVIAERYKSDINYFSYEFEF